MKRRTLDRIISSVGAILVVVLLAMGSGLVWAHSFIHGQVEDQLVAQRITFPEAGSEQIMALSDEDREAVSQYAGQTVKTGDQARVFSEHYINAHLKNIGGGKTYSELSNESRANPTDQAAAAKVETVFRGETLRGLLLNAYAFDTVATVALYAAYVSFASAVVLLGLVYLGFHHAGTVKKH